MKKELVMNILAITLSTISFFISAIILLKNDVPPVGEPGMAAYNQMREETINRNKVKGIIALSVECNPLSACKDFGINAKEECRLSNSY